MHVPGADLNDVGDLRHLRDVAGIQELGHDRQSGLLARLGEDLEALRAETLERIRRRTRLERSSAKHSRTGRGHGAGGLEGLLARLDGARPGDQPEEAVADPAPANLDDASSRA